MKDPKKRADELVLERGFAESRTKAQALIMAGQVFTRKSAAAPREALKKAGQLLPADVILEADVTANQDVGRGAQKLRHALRRWPEIQTQNALALDIGSSTGGFTQVLLEAGALKVVALDVGTHQLHERLRADPRVVSLEKHHVLRMEVQDWAAAGVGPPFDVIVTDVSFISVTKLVSTVAPWLKAGASWVVLVKPQFELGPKKAAGGIVRKVEHHQEAIDLVKSSVEREKGLSWLGVEPSPISGGDGNKEFLAWIKKESF